MVCMTNVMGVFFMLVLLFIFFVHLAGRNGNNFYHFLNKKNNDYQKKNEYQQKKTMEKNEEYKYNLRNDIINLWKSQANI